MENQFVSFRPRRNRAWVEENNKTIVLIPKLGDHIIGRWVMSKMARPNYRVKLDEIGSFVWQKCDGKTTIEQIGDDLTREFGDKIEPVNDRLGGFLNSLAKSKSIVWE